MPISRSFSFVDARPTADHLSPADADALRACALDLADRFRGASLHDEEFLHALELSVDCLSRPMRRRLVAFRDQGNQQGALLITGMPVDDVVPPTPLAETGVPDWTALPVATLSQLVVMSLLGRLLSFSDEKAGRLVQDVFPKPGAEQRQENSGSVLLDLHTEDGFHPNSPHLLSLLCLRGDHDLVAATVTSSVHDVLPMLDGDTVAALQRPEFRVRYSTSFVGEGGEARYTEPMPVLTGHDGDFDMNVDMHLTVATTAEGRRALLTLHEALIANLVGFVPQPGDFVVVDNRKAVHGRCAFVPRYDGTDRWLRRSYVVSDLRPVRPHLIRGRAHAPISI